MAERALKLKIPLKDYFPAQYSVCGKYDEASDVIKSCLTAEQLQLFRQLPWGHLVDVPNIQFSAQIVHMLLLRLVEEQPEDELWFCVHGKVLKFTFADYCHITGLPSTGQMPSSPEEDGAGEDEVEEKEPGALATKYLGGSVEITYEKFKEILQKLRPSKRRDPILAMKLTSLYFVQCVLLAKDRNTRINPDFVRLVNDFDEFKAYPWAKESYNLLVTDLKGLMVGQPEKFKASKAKKSSYRNAKFTVYGAPLVLQVWAYEAIPELGQHFGKKVGDTQVPMLNWSADTILRMTKIKKIVFPEEDEIGSSFDGGQCDEDDHSLQNLKIMEQMQDMCMCLQRMEKRIDAFEHRVSEMKDLILQLISKGKPSGSDNEKKETNTMDEQEPSKGDDTILSGEPSTLSCPIHHGVTSADDILTLDVTEDKRADSIPLEEEETNSVDEQYPSKDEEKIGEPSTVARPIHHDHVTSADDSLPTVVTAVGEDKSPPLTMPGTFQTLDWDGVADDNGTGVIDVEALEELSRQEVKKRKHFRSKYQCSPYTDPLGKRRKPAGNMNPALLGGSDADYAALKAWMEEDDSIEPSSFILDLPSQESVKRAFFQELAEPEEWLSTFHLDSLMYLFAKGMVEKRYELMSPYFVSQLLKKDLKDDKLWCAWVKDKDVTVIDKVFTPFNWEGKHWVLVEIDFVHRLVRVYDSLKSSRTASAVAHLCVRLPYLCRVINCSHTVCESGTMEPWKAEAVNDVPQQEGSSDCGVMVAAFLEALMCDVPLRPYCEYENVHSKRWEFAVRLWRARRIAS